MTRTKLIACLAALYIRFVGKTSKIEFIDDEDFVRVRSDKTKGFIYAFWHGRQLPIIYTHRNQNIVVMVSRSKDGDIMAEILSRFGFSTVRGSTERYHHDGKLRGGTEALLSAIKLLSAGKRIIITPDGPIGPERKLQPGVVYAALKTKTPIVPVGVFVRRKIIIKNWDTYFVPLPFNHIRIFHGKPYYVDNSKPEQQLIKEAEDILNNITDMADKYK